EPEGRAARQHDGVDVLDEAMRIEQGRLPAGGSAAAHLARRHGARRDRHDGDAGTVTGPVPDADPGDVGDQEAASRDEPSARTRPAAGRPGVPPRRGGPRDQNRRTGAPAPRSRAKSVMSASTSAVRSNMSM